MKDEDLVGGCVLILAVATIYLLMTGVAIAMARDGLVLWEDASAAVESISTFATLTVGAVVIAHATAGRARAGPVDRFERDEKEVLQALAPKPYLSLVPSGRSRPQATAQVPSVQVERRSLQVYDRLAESGR